MRFRRLLPALLLATPLSSISSAAEPARRPNVLLILADDLGYSDLSCYGGEIPTPNIDRLAKEGVRFSQFYNSARCCPSRASLMTGLHPHQAGIGSFTTAKPEEGRGKAYTGHLVSDCITIPEVLKSAGYSTWMVGKWHLANPGPIELGFDNYFGFRDLIAHSTGQWDPNNYTRLPKETPPELSYDKGSFYATDVFTDYTLEFLKQARTQKDKPWFLYLAHSAPHFPLQAPKEDIDAFMPTYRKGWDVLRAERFERIRKLGLIPADATLPPRAMVPVDQDAIANGFPGQQNPAWDSLPEDRREDLARRMATFAAMVKHVDLGVGRILADLEKNGELDNTLVLFTSDNGACYEWGPFGFDGESRRGITELHTGAELDRMGQPMTHSAYGSGWANLGNTPLSMYKHFCQEGGICSPFIARWPAGVKTQDSWSSEPLHLMDVMPTICAATGAVYPDGQDGHPIQKEAGESFLPLMKGQTLPPRTLEFEHQEARAIRRGEWKAVLSKRTPQPPHWELYNMNTDRMEQHDVSSDHADLLQSLVDEWTGWAVRVGVDLRK